METRHNVTDPAKVARLVASMERDGWQGAPIVVDGDLAITGVHRLAAWRALGYNHADAPTIDVREVYAEANLDYDAIVAEETDNGRLDWDVCAEWILGALPSGIAETYGIES